MSFVGRARPKRSWTGVSDAMIRQGDRGFPANTAPNTDMSDASDSDDDADFGFAGEEFDEPDWAEEFNDPSGSDSDDGEEEVTTAFSADYGFIPPADEPPSPDGSDQGSPQGPVFSGVTLDPLNAIAEGEEPEEILPDVSRRNSLVNQPAIDLPDHAVESESESESDGDGDGDGDWEVGLDGINLGLRLAKPVARSNAPRPRYGAGAGGRTDANPFKRNSSLGDFGGKSGWLAIYVQTGKKVPKNLDKLKWKEKWVALEDGKLHFKESPNSKIDSKQTKTIDMASVKGLYEDTTGKHPDRYIMDAGKRKGVKYYFQAVDQHECRAWLNVKYRALDVAKRKGKASHRNREENVT